MEEQKLNMCNEEQLSKDLQNEPRMETMNKGKEHIRSMPGSLQKKTKKQFIGTDHIASFISIHLHAVSI